MGYLYNGIFIMAIPALERWQSLCWNKTHEVHTLIDFLKFTEEKPQV